MQGAAFRCEVLLAQAREPSWPRIGDLLATGYPVLARDARIEPQRGGHARVWLGRTEIECTYVAYASPAARGTAHAAHVVIHGEDGAARDLADRVALARRLTALAATLALRRDCQGALWNEVPRLIPAEDLRRAGPRMEAGRDPLRLWVDLVGEETTGDPPLRTLRTIGLAPFAGREIELEPGPESADVQAHVVGGVLSHVFADGAMIEPGSMFRIENAGDFSAELLDEGATSPGPVCRLGRLPTAEDASQAVGGASRSGRRRCSAIILFNPARAPDTDDLIRAIGGVTKRLGLAPEVSEAAADRLVADWGVVRGGGARKSEIIHRGWSLPEPLVAFILAENAEVALKHPELLAASVPVLIREMPMPDGGEQGILGATLLTNLAAALLTLPGARGMIWPTAGILATREDAEASFRRAGADLPIGLTVARLALELEDGGRVFVTRGLADLGERDILMLCDNPADPVMRNAFEALVQGVFRRQMTRKGEVFVNEVDGAAFELREEPIAGIGTVLKAKMVAPPRRPSGLKRFLRRKD